MNTKLLVAQKVVELEQQLQERYKPEDCTSIDVFKTLMEHTGKSARDFVFTRYPLAEPRIVSNKVAIFDTVIGTLATEKENYAKEQHRMQRLGEFTDFNINSAEWCILKAFRLAAKSIVAQNPFEMPEPFSAHRSFMFYDEILTKAESYLQRSGSYDEMMRWLLMQG